jgi:hypothetical protein
MPSRRNLDYNPSNKYQRELGIHRTMTGSGTAEDMNDDLSLQGDNKQKSRHTRAETDKKGTE